MKNLQIILAPMQGVLDPLVRQLLTSINEYDLCISEFVRVVDSRLPPKSFYRLCPELRNNGLTQSGTPVRVQLLGQHPQWLAENAQRAIELGSQGIDLNCGCPSKTVNGNMGGASLLKDPELIYQATKAIRGAVPKKQVVSVKIRLGWDSALHSFEIADAVEQGGANEITIHGRTKKDGYKAEKINWLAIRHIQQRLNIPVIANGEIWDYKSAKKCCEVTACNRLMIGRGALNMPNLSKVIKYDEPKLSWQEVLVLLQQYLHMENQFDSGFYHTSRIKQWLKFLLKEYEEANTLFNKVKVAQCPLEVKQCIKEI
ncbi:tRNA dihydrouridine(16) synthase DusC [Pasteurella skyensis]|uniref:tRNA-dihydrouridine(16) synthase n=1 Tax=Phocoenobacter skyensis TaxID=97481 RepID=A0AAJ6N9G4_9PAST|nr:tRNA dihydrouridine(16) synthase DusC [Pasteurella skyensis]MDP8162202.1 tRNA dihydrouridine(16) synthase DusC [Pasteurella skyensis]MDP8172666.1 tRNA dihydrouridine(16) synthase DusC [Pasteurella skyensis]MDP8176828.1 tRNA dihydrouridine(16) synthase DusC [Pasteurella skyensis]MDP8179166.1 tRNA dihydrouridine(16) synthase DusC [Pasteurella skyensis]MDP8183379.1 tRNA dihydrouridine(16) synthase DusC [Pasteurella skyensis]